MQKPISFWIRFSIVNLLIVASLGILMRYKIAYSFPFLDQKHLQHAHSHFAFAAWVSQSLFAMQVFVFSHYLEASRLKKYQLLLWANVAAALGMLVAFSLQGYAGWSIAFSTLSLLTGFLFAFFYFRDCQALRHEVFQRWLTAGHFFNIISALGTAGLAWVMVNKIGNQQLRLGSLYYYLHFQYNGWFFFAAMGLLLFYAREKLGKSMQQKTLFRLLFYSALPAFFLSTLWARLPVWLYGITVLAALAQTLGWIGIFRNAWREKWIDRLVLPKAVYGLFVLSALAFCLKFLLQLFSVIPEVSRLAFGFRNIVIAYLHLVLLAGFSLFLLAYFALIFPGIYAREAAKKALLLIAAGVFINEFILLIQGVAGFVYIPVPYAAEMLLAAAIIIGSGVLWLVITMGKESRPPGGASIYRS